MYGHDGFDVDVLRNLQSLYSGLNFKIAISRTLIPADILVIQRPPSAALDLSQYGAVHLYDYVANDLTTLLRSCGDHPGLLIFASSSARREQLVEKFPELSEKIDVSPPPVDTRLWISRNLYEEAKFDLVHIGNHKPYYSDGNDVYAAQFLGLLQNGGVHVWGAGWDGLIDAGHWHGRSSIAKVSSIYASSRIALGMMYPHQRSVSLSGRFWHAPLNGCQLISEPSIFADAVPGVLSSDYAHPPAAGLPPDDVDRIQLAKEAATYWEDAYGSLMAVARGHLETCDIGSRRPTLKFVRAFLLTQIRNARWAVS